MKKKNKGLLALEARNQAIQDMKKEFDKSYIPCNGKKKFNFLMLTFAVLQNPDMYF